MREERETGDPAPSIGFPPDLSAATAAASPAPLTPPVRGEGILRVLERSYLYLDRALGRLLPEPLNPFMQTGAVAVTSLIVATVTGVILLLWYRPSVHLAYESVAAMSTAPWTAGLMRSLHRYSSDLCMFFVLVHALRSLIERRFTGPRWLPWVTGFVTLGILWFIGWTGYWLVWDERAQLVAVGTARILDVVPIFSDPLGRSFLIDASINSLLFFVVFFFHMLIPLALVLLLWLHLARISRPRFLTRTVLSVWVLASLVVLSLAYPADSAGPARMTAISPSFSMDWWYLLPLALTDRFGGGALWAMLLISGAVFSAVPWWLGRGRRLPARVDPAKCNACMQCYQDCPYDAIAMVPRTAGRMQHPVQAEVDLAKCVGCGICAGSCDPGAASLEWLATTDQRKKLEGWVNEVRAEGEKAYVALICAESAGGLLSVDTASGRCPELPGYRVLMLPCAAWTHMVTIERLLRRGADGVLLAGCGPGDCRSREGEEWLGQRLDGLRDPMLRTDKVDRSRVQVLTLNRTRKRDLLRDARAFREGAAIGKPPLPGSMLAGVAATLLALLIVVGVGVVSDLGYAAPELDGSQLVVSFKHPGMISENCREISEEEQAKQPAHMRKDKICDRARSPVRLRVSVDGELRLDRAYPPSGIWSDGPSVAIEPIPIAPGERRVEVALGESADPNEWTFTSAATMTFVEDARRVLLFDRLEGFTWH